MKIKRAIISVSNKDGVVDLAKALRSLDVEIISTGGTLALLEKNKIKALPISSYTGFPEMLDGRVKTLHPKLHGGLLYRRDKKAHVSEAKKHGILPIDLVVVNLYPFEQVTSAGNVPLERAVEEIDIGGPTMLRSAAKNFKSVAVLADPADYAPFLEELKASKGKVSEKTLYRLACKVFQLTSQYDTVIARYLTPEPEGQDLPDTVQALFRKNEVLRYGENPHQKAALYQEAGKGPAIALKKLHGKELSYNNLVDIESAWDVVEEYDHPAACVVKHNTPCGIAMADSLEEAVSGAIDGDPEASFGGIIGLNRACDLKTAETIFNKLGFLEVIAAPSFQKKAVDFLTTRKNLRLVELTPERKWPHSYRLTKLGLLLQDADGPLKAKWEEFQSKARCVTQEQPTADDWNELFFAWRAVKVVKSNGIVLTKGRRTVGIGAGQMSRVDAVRIACTKAGDKTRGSYLASDGFFPMPDNIEVAASYGVRAIVQPGGSIKDKDVIDAANRHKIVMIATGMRHFRH